MNLLEFANEYYGLALIVLGFLCSGALLYLATIFYPRKDAESDKTAITKSLTSVKESVDKFTLNLTDRRALTDARHNQLSLEVKNNTTEIKELETKVNTKLDEMAFREYTQFQKEINAKTDVELGKIRDNMSNVIQSLTEVKADQKHIISTLAEIKISLEKKK